MVRSKDRSHISSLSYPHHRILCAQALDVALTLPGALVRCRPRSTSIEADCSPRLMQATTDNRWSRLILADATRTRAARVWLLPATTSGLGRGRLARISGADRHPQNLQNYSTGTVHLMYEHASWTPLSSITPHGTPLFRHLRERASSLASRCGLSMVGATARSAGRSPAARVSCCVHQTLSCWTLLADPPAASARCVQTTHCMRTLQLRAVPALSSNGSSCGRKTTIGLSGTKLRWAPMPGSIASPLAKAPEHCRYQLLLADSSLMQLEQMCLCACRISWAISCARSTTRS